MTVPRPATVSACVWCWAKRPLWHISLCVNRTVEGGWGGESERGWQGRRIQRVGERERGVN